MLLKEFIIGQKPVSIGQNPVVYSKQISYKTPCKLAVYHKSRYKIMDPVSAAPPILSKIFVETLLVSYASALSCIY